jgi:hypothetical protein
MQKELYCGQKGRAGDPEYLQEAPDSKSTINAIYSQIQDSVRILRTLFGRFRPSEDCVSEVFVQLKLWPLCVNNAASLPRKLFLV